MEGVKKILYEDEPFNLQSDRGRWYVRSANQQAIYFALATRRTTPKTLNLDLASFEHKKLLRCFGRAMPYSPE